MWFWIRQGVKHKSFTTFYFFKMGFALCIATCTLRYCHLKSQTEVKFVKCFKRARFPIFLTLYREKRLNRDIFGKRMFYSSILNKFSLFVLKSKLTPIILCKPTTTLAWIRWITKKFLFFGLILKNVTKIFYTNATCDKFLVWSQNFCQRGLFQNRNNFWTRHTFEILLYVCSFVILSS